MGGKTNEGIEGKGEICQKAQTTASKIVTYQSCMEAEDKPKKAKAAPVDKACKYVEILLNQRPKLTKSKRKKKKARVAET